MLLGGAISGPRYHRLLPLCDQDRTNQPHQAPCQEHSGVWFLVGLGCLRLGYRKFVNRRSAAHKKPTAGGNTLANYLRASGSGLNLRGKRLTSLWPTVCVCGRRTRREAWVVRAVKSTVAQYCPHLTCGQFVEHCKPLFLRATQPALSLHIFWKSRMYLIVTR